ncbi:MAG: hypothetical protein ACI35R_11400 [Bacillus sp. (in: firmicutes)]
MEKTIVIDGKEVPFKSTGGSALRYKAQFGRDFFADVAKLGSTFKKINKNKVEKLELEDLEGIDLNFFYNVAWVFAKTANSDIGDQIAWLDTFDSFPIVDIIPELQELLVSTLETKKK